MGLCHPLIGCPGPPTRPFCKLSETPGPVNPTSAPAHPWPGLPGAGCPARRPGLGRCPAARLHFSPASLSLYPWDKRLIPQGVKGKINHPGEISQPADLAGETKRNRESHGLVGSPIKGWKNACFAITNGRHRRGRVLSPSPRETAAHAVLEKVAVSSPGHCPPPGQPQPLCHLWGRSLLSPSSLTLRSQAPVTSVTPHWHP